MNTEKNIINLIFDPGKGSLSQISREAVSGAPYGTLPKPTREGYRFDGWFLGDERITSDTLIASDVDVRLVARWTREKKKDRKTSMLKRQKIAIGVLSAVAVLLVVVLIAVLDLISIYTFTDTYTVNGVEYTDTYTVKKHGGVYKLFDSQGNLMDRNVEEEAPVYIAKNSGNQYRIDEETGEWKLVVVVDTEGIEAAPGTQLLMYPQILSGNIQSIKVELADGSSYRFLNEGDGIYIDGFRESLIEYNQDLYARLCSACGYTLVSKKLSPREDGSTVPVLEDGSIDYAVYGLDKPQATFTVSAIKNKNAKPYEADPARTYTVYIGDKTISGTDYYVRLADAKIDAVYILSATYFDEALLRPIEELIVPKATYNVTLNEHTMVQDFYLTRLDSWLSGDEDTDIKGEPVVSFDYEELEYRINTLLTTAPFVCDSDLFEGMEGYTINDGKASKALSALHSMEYLGCRALGLNAQTLAEFGLDENVFYLTYKTKTSQRDENGNILYANNRMLISEKTKDGTYYIASIPHDMIVEVDQYYLSFLEWDRFEWYNQYFMSADVSYLKEMKLDFGGGKSYTFKMDNTFSYAYYKRWKDAEQTESEYVEYQMKAGDTVRIDENGYYWYERPGQEPRRVAVIDFSKVLRVSQLKAQTTYAGYGKILYEQDAFYYYDENQKVVRVTPDYGRGDVITERDGKYYYTIKGVITDLPVNKTDSSELIYRFEKGHEITLDVDSDNLLIFCDDYKGTAGGYMDYVNEHVYVNDHHVEVSETFTARDNFRNFYMQILSFSLYGDVDEDEFVQKMGMTPDEFLASDKAIPTATFQTFVEDNAVVLNDTYKYGSDGNAYKVHTENVKRHLVFRFYNYTAMKSMLTVEVLVQNENGEWVSEGVPPVGKFFVDASTLRTIEANAEKLVKGEYISK